ncbi:MAG TPA: hypothetical protein V6C95_00480, partial [Coleofasciculaceae cyanobacterium]
TEPIDRSRAVKTVKAAYTWINEPQPEILFADSPYAAVSMTKEAYELCIKTHGNLRYRKLRDRLNIRWHSNGLGELFQQQLETQLYQRNPDKSLLLNDLKGYFEERSWVTTRHNINAYVRCCIRDLQEDRNRWRDMYGLIDCLEFFETTPSWLDFCISVLDCDCDRQLWEILQALVTSCHSILPFEGVCVICDRPNRLSFDTENRLYAKGEPAIEFRDGFGIYVYENEWIGGVLKAPERQELDEEQLSVSINSLPSQLTFLVGDNHLSFSHWTYHPESQQYVPHSETLLQDTPRRRGELMPLVICQNSLFMGYPSQEGWTIARLDGVPTLGQEAIAPTIKRTFESLGAIATDGNYLWVGAEFSLMLLDQNLEVLDRVSLDVGWFSHYRKNAHNILIYQNTAYVLDNISRPILLFQAKVNSRKKLELVRALEVYGKNIHLDHQWLNPSLNQWVVIASSAGHEGIWQNARIFPMHLVNESEKSLEIIGNVEVLARTEKPPFWAVIHDPAAGCFVTCFQDLETGTEIGERIPLELKTDFRGRYRVHLEQSRRNLKITNSISSEFAFCKQFLFDPLNYQINSGWTRMIETRKDSYFKCPTQLSCQSISSLNHGGQDRQAKDFRVIAVTHIPPIWAVILETESQEYFLAAIETENNRMTMNNPMTIGSKLPLDWRTSRNQLEIIFRQNNHVLVIWEHTHDLLTIVDVQETPQIIHRQVLNPNRQWKVRDLLIQNKAE